VRPTHPQPTEKATLDYVPCVAIAPIDMTEHLRARKAHRKIRLLIGITAYNEEGDELKRSLVRGWASWKHRDAASVHPFPHSVTSLLLSQPVSTPYAPLQTGIAENLPSLQKAGLHWSEVAVAVLVDGRERAAPSMLEYASSVLKVYDPTLLRFFKHDAPVTMHFFGASAWSKCLW
jgi:CheY-like chemotaxis protein